MTSSMTFCILGSGSSGNATLVEHGSSSILIDAGFSGRELERRLRAAGREPSDIAAILLSHEHTDHVRGVGVLARKHGLPVYANPGTFARVQKYLQGVEQRPLAAAEPLRIGSITIAPFRVEHDANEPLGFELCAGGERLCIATDLGYINQNTRDRFRDASVMIIEANYDDLMLWKGSYPEALKRRIFSIQGHLSNEAAARFLAESIGPSTKHVCLAHLSRDNNTPDLAYTTVKRILSSNGSWPVNLLVATADTILGPLQVE